MRASRRRLTRFLLDLTEDEELSDSFQKDPGSVITARKLDKYRDLLLNPDVGQLRAAVRAELGGPPPGRPVLGVMQPNVIIAGVQKPPPMPGVQAPPPEKPMEGVMEPPPIEGVQEPPPEEEAMPGVQEPPPDEPIPGVQEPGGPPDQA